MRPPDWLTNFKSCCHAGVLRLRSSRLMTAVRWCPCILCSCFWLWCYLNSIAAVGVSWVPAVTVVSAVAGISSAAGVLTVVDNPSANYVSPGLASLLLLLSSPHVPVCLLCCCRPCFWRCTYCCWRPCCGQCLCCCCRPNCIRRISAFDFQRFCRPCYCWRPCVVDVPAFGGVPAIDDVPALDDVPAVTWVLAIINFPTLGDVPLVSGESCSSSQVMLEH